MVGSSHKFLLFVVYELSECSVILVEDISELESVDDLTSYRLVLCFAEHLWSPLVEDSFHFQNQDKLHLDFFSLCEELHPVMV